MRPACDARADEARRRRHIKPASDDMSDQPTDTLQLDKLEVDKNNLYREEIFTDLRVATIRRLVPIKIDGSEDPGREPLYSAETQILTPQGPLPIQVPIEAKTLEEAIGKFSGAVHQGVERLVEEARQIRREASSRIVTPAEAGLGSKIILDR
jgi:hypothetical protein